MGLEPVDVAEPVASSDYEETIADEVTADDERRKDGHPRAAERRHTEGVDRDDTQLAFFAVWPNAVTATSVAREVFQEN